MTFRQNSLLFRQGLILTGSLFALSCYFSCILSSDFPWIRLFPAVLFFLLLTLPSTCKERITIDEAGIRCTRGAELL